MRAGTAPRKVARGKEIARLKDCHAVYGGDVFNESFHALEIFLHFVTVFIHYFVSHLVVVVLDIVGEFHAQSIALALVSCEILVFFGHYKFAEKQISRHEFGKIGDNVEGEFGKPAVENQKVFDVRQFFFYLFVFIGFF